MSPLPDKEVMYRALAEKDASFEGLFFLGVRSTGIFCRPGCPARKPKRENVDFFPAAKDALLAGYRPCKRCRPMEAPGLTPPALQRLLNDIHADPEQRLKDADLRRYGLQPSQVRRWFKKHHGMTFQGYLRSLRINRALGQIHSGAKVIDSAFASGYESLSGFTGAFKKKMGRSPGQSAGAPVIVVARLLTPLGPMLAGATDAGRLPAGIQRPAHAGDAARPAGKTFSRPLSARPEPAPRRSCSANSTCISRAACASSRSPWTWPGRSFKKRSGRPC